MTWRRNGSLGMTVPGLTKEEAWDLIYKLIQEQPDKEGDKANRVSVHIQIFERVNDD